MRKAKRNAIKLESKVQALSAIKISGTADERQFARKRLNDGLSSRWIKGQRLGRIDSTDTFMGKSVR